MGRIADIPTHYWLTCVELDRPPGTGLQYIVPSLEDFLNHLPEVHDHDPLLSRWRICVTKIDSRVPMHDVQTQFRRDDCSFEIQKTVEVDLRQVAQEFGFQLAISP